MRNAPQGQKCCPVLPNLFFEGKLGYDVKMRKPGSIFFFQFKIPKAVIYNSSYERKQFKIGSRDPFCGLKLPFLRMPITKNNISRQHELLINLQDRKRNNAAKVFYATPLFVDPKSLNKNFITSSVHHSSGFISPEEIGDLLLIDRHFVSYNMEDNYKIYGWVCTNNVTNKNRWPYDPSNLHFGPMKCVRIYKYIELEQIAIDFQKDGKQLCESIEEVSKDLEGIIDGFEHLDEESRYSGKDILCLEHAGSGFLESRRGIDEAENIYEVYKDSGKFISSWEYDREYSPNYIIRDADEEAYMLARQYFKDKLDENEAKLQSLEFFSRKHEKELPLNWLLDIPRDLRESFESLYALQHLVRSYFGCEMAIFQPK